MINNIEIRKCVFELIGMFFTKGGKIYVFNFIFLGNLSK